MSTAHAVTEWPEDIAAAGKRLREGSLTCVQLAEHYLGCIEMLQPVLNAMITVTASRALEDAGRLDAELAAGRDRGPLHGIPIVYKDNINTRGIPTTAGSEYFRDRIPDDDATIVRRLQDAGVVMLGKANMSEFASGSSGVNVFHGDVHNPWDLERAPGGSSSGTGAAIAAGMCMAGIGTDSGGSIRQPASRCNLVGVRPTFGRVSLAGVWPRTRTLGAGGPMSRTVADSAILLNVLAGHDPAYPPSLNAPAEDFVAGLGRGLKGIRIGIVDGFTFENIEDEVAAAVHGAVSRFSELGAEIRVLERSVISNSLDYASLFVNVLLYEFNSILGGHYRAAEDREARFGPMVHSDLARGEQVTRQAYESILAERPGHVRKFRQVFREVDVLLTPSLPNIPPLQSSGPEVWARGRQFNLPFSFVGVPAMSMPCDFSTTGLPIGMQLVADELQESLLLRVGAAYEEATRHYLKRPPVHCSSPENAGINSRSKGGAL
ncbi:MAG: amidase [Burkholderiales bacterium]|nr:amidase [Burkholderiales bacterium]